MNDQSTRPSAPASADMPLTMAEALSRLVTASELARLSRTAALGATEGLSGAWLTRCNELAEKLADAVAHAQRLAFIVLGDVRADEAGQRVGGGGGELDGKGRP
jgi:hypothetical protein